MPRKKIELSHEVETLSILDAEGRFDKELEPDIPPEFLLKLHRAMLLGRRFDERLLNLQRQGRIGTFAPIKGQEASQLGAVAALEPSDWMCPSFREMAAELWRGKPMEDVILTFGGYNEGGHISMDRNDLPMAIPVSSQILHAVGIAWGIKYRKKNDVALTFFGDGGTSEGDFHEGLNFAAVYQAPVIFVCQNNQWAISVPRSMQTHSKTIAQKALAYDMPGIQVDGNDILAVYVAAREAVDRARSGEGPTLIECVTYRLMMHTTADDPKRYRPDEEVEKWGKRDPLPRFQKYLKDKGLLDNDAIGKVEEEVLVEIQSAVDRAEERMKQADDPLVMFDHAYDEMPQTLIEQKQELIDALERDGKEGNNG
ncbi:MAG: pyruvate dehydrogenase (acetyl-transferring) E1 component subunit alpha [Deltaproteobacteria bacterium]|nr:pyruvate dehydrogenase (acetyl-transferring) E1 component subunit alpha [Deltaproteobacteria bacterium]